MNRRAFTLIEVLVAAGVILLVGSYVGRLALDSREVTDQGQRQTQAAQILARLGKEAQRGNPQVVPPSGTRSLEAAFLSGLMGRGVDGYRAEVRAAPGSDGLRDYALRVCWAEGCVEGNARGPAPLAGVAGNPPAQVQLGRGVLEVLVEGQVATPPDVHVTSGPSDQRVQRWGLTRLEGLPPGNYTVTALGIRTDRYTYEAPAVGSATLGAGQGSQVTVQYQPVSGAISLDVNAPQNTFVNATLFGPSGTYRVSGSGLFPYLKPGTYTLSAPSTSCGEYRCEARITGSPAQVTPGQTQSLTLTYGYASGNLQVQFQGLSGGSAEVQGPNGYRATLSGNTLLRNLAPGEYTLTPYDMYSGGYTYRAGGTRVSVQAGQTAQATLTYAMQTGLVDLSVSGAPSSYSLTLSGPRNYSLSAPGSYEIAASNYNVLASDVREGGFLYRATVSPSSVYLPPNGRVAVSLSYTKQAGRFRFTLSGLPAGAQAPLTLSGPGSYSANLANGTATTPDLPPGAYTLSTPDLAAGGYTWRASGNAGWYTLGVGSTLPVALSYAPITGRVQVNVSGVPSGAAPTLRIMGGGTLHSFSGSASYELSPGSYVLQADPFVFAGKSYIASGAGSFNVTAGQTATMSVTYAPK